MSLSDLFWVALACFLLFCVVFMVSDGLWIILVFFGWFWDIYCFSQCEKNKFFFGSKMVILKYVYS